MTARKMESLVSALDARGCLVGADVLDLFAGSGVLAAEALSRGASSAVVVEVDRGTAALATQNMETLGFDAVASVHATSVLSFLGSARAQDSSIDLVFCDPPYDLEDVELDAVLRMLVERVDLAESATIVVHRRFDEPPAPPGWSIQWTRTFGDSLISLMRTDPRDPS